MRIGKKFIHHACLLGALVAPAVYLFGSMFMGLAGAHGEDLWAQEAGKTEYWVEYNGKQYKYLDTQYYWSFNNPYEYAEYSGDLYVYLDITKPYVKYDLESMQELNTLLDVANINTNALAVMEYPSHYVSMIADHSGALTEQLNRDEIFIDETNENICACFWVSSEENTDHLAWYVEIFKDTEGAIDIISYYEEDSWDNSGEWSVLPVGYVLKFGSKPFNTINTDNLNNIINYNWHSENYNQNYTDGIFGNFFPRENFLEKWGSDAISDNPVGFAPFGQLFRYLDDNMLHFGMNENQAGLMAYGYMYWIGHVFIADLALCCLVFIPKLLRKIVDKVGGNDD